MLKKIRIVRAEYLISILIIIFLLVLPYILFEGKLYIGGDDTRLLYSYPKEFLQNYALYSWLNFSTAGVNAPWQFLAPFLSVWTGLSLIISNKITLSYFAFSLPLILALIYLQKLIKEIISKSDIKFEPIIGSLFFILSPILVYNQLFIFLSTVWLIGLVPILLYYYLRYIKFGFKKDILKSLLWSIFLSLSFFSIPWILGIFFPLIISIIILLPILKLNNLKIIIKRTFIYSIFIFIVNQFWFFPFISTYIFPSENNFGTKILSKEILDTFTPTVIYTATGNILYPILNLYHRQIAFDFNWYLADIFNKYFDKLLFFNCIYIGVIILGSYIYIKYKDNLLRQKYLLFFVAFVISLLLFTINIGPFKEIFIFFGLNIPGFAMFRNFYDKFALGYIFIYSIFISLALVIIKDHFDKRIYRILLLGIVFVLILNFIPIKKTLNAPLWMTKNTYRNITFPNEYLEIISIIKSKVSPSSNILNYPLTSSVYSVIKEEGTNNTYVGTSPLKTLTNVNDFSGSMSFSYGSVDVKLDRLMFDKKYEQIADYLNKYNINYILYTKNVPENVLKAFWIYSPYALNAIDEKFFSTLVKSKVAESKNGNYVLYDLKKQSSAIEGDNIYFTKINPVKYKIYIKNLDNTKLVFNESYHGGWKLYLNKNPNANWCNEQINKVKSSIECKSKFSSLDIFYKDGFLNNNLKVEHSIKNDYANAWMLDANKIKSSYSNDYYEINKDGKIDIEMTMFFDPQNNFLIGILISLIGLTSILFLLIYDKKNKHK